MPTQDNAAEMTSPLRVPLSTVTGPALSKDSIMRKVLRITLGTLLILLGIVGLFLPFLQGFLFLSLGCLVLSRDIPFLARLENRILTRFPRIGRSMERLKKVLRLKRI